ncbi:MAG TPA: sulfate ABC transporter substrate-binding protein [Candidatus Limnocylindrales bacterium]|nr:sulfate ABC transporter substrate-binding protein [Candidatus Limnocylindrales bacterium]
MAPRLAWATLALALAACGGTSAGAGSKVELSLVAYSTPQAAYEQIIKAYQATPEGRNVGFKKSFGASGDQSRAVEAGLKADIVALSLEPDITRLVKAGIVADDWNRDSTQGMITKSVVVLAIRKGNPKGIKGWDDLTRPGVEVITPNPFTSGGARWNVLAAYGAKSGAGSGSDKDRPAGVAYLNALFRNVPVQDESARKALQTFTSGKGDAMLAYENEVIFAQQNGQALDYVVPDSTILIENPIAIATGSAHPAEAKAFLAYLHSPAAQEIFARNGYRPIIQGVQNATFPNPPGLFTIADLGGWTKVTKDFFDTNTGIMAAVERSIGVSVK